MCTCSIVLSPPELRRRPGRKQGMKLFSITAQRWRVSQSGRPVIAPLVGACPSDPDAARAPLSSGLCQRGVREAVVEACVAACVDAEAHTDLAAKPITFGTGRRSSWSVPTRGTPCISASGAGNADRRCLLPDHYTLGDSTLGWCHR